VAVRTFRRRLRINNYGSSLKHTDLRVALVAGHVGMPALQGEVRAGIVVERRRNPALRIVAVGARSFSRLCELARMDVFVAILTNLGRALELHLLGSNRDLVTGTAAHGAVCPKQWKLSFCMVETIDVGPGSRGVAGLTAKHRAVGAVLRHPFLEFTMMRIGMARGAVHVGEAEGHDLIRAPR